MPRACVQTIAEAREVNDCTGGCRAWIESGVRVVDPDPECPAHGRPAHEAMAEAMRGYR